MITVVNPNEYRSSIGLKNLYVAEVLEDDNSGYVADTPEYMAPACEATSTPKSNSKIQYADNQPYDPMTAEGETEIKLKATAIPSMLLAKITGRVADLTTGRVYDNNGIPPYYALMFESLRADGKVRYFAYLKGRFMMPPETFVSTSDTPNPQIPEIVFEAVKTIYQFVLSESITDGVKRVFGDQDVLNFDASNWYTAVPYPAIGSISSPSLSSSTPANNATGISVSTTVALNFNNPMAQNAEKHVVLMNATTFAIISVTATLSTDRKTITLTPGSALSASTEYLVVMPVLDLYGQQLDAAIKFTTA